MRVAFLIISILAVVPSFAAPIDPVHFEELEARWHNPFKNGGLKKFVRTATKVYKKVAPIAKAVAPLIVKRDDEIEEHLHRRDDSEFEKREEDLDALE